MRGREGIINGRSYLILGLFLVSLIANFVLYIKNTKEIERLEEDLDHFLKLKNEELKEKENQILQIRQTLSESRITSDKNTRNLQEELKQSFEKFNQVDEEAKSIKDQLTRCVLSLETESKKIQELQQDIAECSQEVSAKDELIAGLELENEDLVKDVKKLETSLTAYGKTVKAAEERLKTAENHAQEAKNRMQETVNQLKVLEEKYKTQEGNMVKAMKQQLAEQEKVAAKEFWNLQTELDAVKDSLDEKKNLLAKKENELILLENENSKLKVALAEGQKKLPNQANQDEKVPPVHKVAPPKAEKKPPPIPNK